MKNSKSVSTITVPFQGSNFVIDIADGKMMSLNTIYALVGRPAFKEPGEWLRLPDSEQIINELCNSQNTGKSHLLKFKRGKGGGTWAHWKIAVKYAAYLAPALDSAILDVFRERVQEELNPELALTRGRERAIAGWKRQGQSDLWISQRCKTADSWNGLTSVLKSHGVEGIGYAKCADAINIQILGSTAKEFRKENQITTTSLRDSLSKVKNAAIDLAQALSEEKIDTENSRGNNLCAAACFDSASKVSRVFQ